MDLSLSFYITSIVAILMTGISKSGFGGGLGVMAVPIMAMFVTPQFAAAVMMPILLAMDIMVVTRYWRKWDRATIVALLPGAFIGLCIGAYTFQYFETDTIRFLVGLLALFFVIQFVLGRKNLPSSSQKKAGFFALLLGAVSGFASFVAHSGGPPVKGYLLKQNLPKTDFVGTNTIFFFTLNAIKTIAYGSTGTLTFESLSASLLLAPVLFIGVFIGMFLHQKIDQKIFLKIVYVFLMITAVKLLSDSIPSLLL